MKIKLTFFTLLAVLLIVSNNSNAFMFWNQACNFIGPGNRYVAVPSSSTLNIIGSFTIEAWVCPVNVSSPANQMLIEKTNPAGNGYNLYLKSGRVVMATNGNIILVGKAVLPNNTWAHISASLNASTDSAIIFLNSLVDTAALSINSEPNSNADSLRIGRSRHIATIGAFKGFMDEIRIWNRAVPRSEVINNYRLSLAGGYDQLALSLTFQNKNGVAPVFSLNDWSTNNNNGINKGVTALDLSNRPSTTIFPNASVSFDGTSYLAGADNPDISPTTGITIESMDKSLDSDRNPNH